RAEDGVGSLGAAGDAYHAANEPEGTVEWIIVRDVNESVARFFPVAPEIIQHHVHREIADVIAGAARCMRLLARPSSFNVVPSDVAAPRRIGLPCSSLLSRLRFTARRSMRRSFPEPHCPRPRI